MSLTMSFRDHVIVLIFSEIKGDVISDSNYFESEMISRSSDENVAGSDE